jgi:hypothetical protein
VPCISSDCLHVHRAEGDALSKKNRELEATSRSLRSNVRDLEVEHERTMTRLRATEGQLLETQQKLEQHTAQSSSQASTSRVSCCSTHVGTHVPPCATLTNRPERRASARPADGHGHGEVRAASVRCWQQWLWMQGCR